MSNVNIKYLLQLIDYYININYTIYIQNTSLKIIYFICTQRHDLIIISIFVDRRPCTLNFKNSDSQTRPRVRPINANKWRKTVVTKR